MTPLIKSITVSALCFNKDSKYIHLTSLKPFFKGRNVICTLIHPRLKHWSSTWMKSTKLRKDFSSICLGDFFFFAKFKCYSKCSFRVNKSLSTSTNKALRRWLTHERGFIGAHPNEKGTNIALIILPQDKASTCRGLKLCLTIHTIAGPFYCISWHSLKEQLYITDDTAVKFVHCTITISWF